jgi:hypothetical protein
MAEQRVTFLQLCCEHTKIYPFSRVVRLHSYGLVAIRNNRKQVKYSFSVVLKKKKVFVSLQ